MRRTIITILFFILFAGIVQGFVTNEISDHNYKNQYGNYNQTVSQGNISNFTRYYGDGSFLTGVAGSISNQTIIDVANTEFYNKTVSDGRYIQSESDPVFVAGNTSIWSAINLRLLTSTFTSENASIWTALGLRYLKTETYNKTEIDSKVSAVNETGLISTQTSRIDTLNSTKAQAGASAACTYGIANITLNAQGVPTVTCATAQGDITGVTATGPGLTGGGTTGALTIGLNDTYVNSKWNDTTAISTVDSRVTNVNATAVSALSLAGTANSTATQANNTATTALSTAQANADPGTCASGTVVQNTTTGGVQCVTDKDTTYTNGTGLTLSSTTFSHTDTSSQASSDNSARTYIQDILLDTFGHITSITTATETITDSIWSITGSKYIYNATGKLEVNETALNNTIVSVSSRFNETSKIPTHISNLTNDAGFRAINQNVNTTSNVIFSTLNTTTLNLGATGKLYTGTGSAYFGGGGDTGDRLNFDGGGESIQWNNFNEWYMPKTGDVNFQRWSESGTTRFVAGAGGGAWHSVYIQNNLTVDGTIFGNLNASYVQNAPWITNGQELNGPLNWTLLQNYPAACSAGYAVTTIGDSNTCTQFVTAETDPTAVKNNTAANLTILYVQQRVVVPIICLNSACSSNITAS